MRNNQDLNAPRQSRQTNLLRILEYASLVASGIGVVISVASQQIVYTAAPLSFSLLLNLVNRQRIERQTNQYLTLTLTRLDQKVRQIEQSSEDQIQSIESTLDRRITQLQSDITVLRQSQTLETLARNLADLQAQQAALSENTNQMRLDLNSSVSINQFEQLRSEIQKLQDDQIQILENQQQNYANIQQGLEQRLTVINNQLEQRIANLLQNSEYQIEQIDSRLNQQLTNLQNDLIAIQVLDLQSIPPDLSLLQNHCNFLSESINHIEARLEQFFTVDEAKALKAEVYTLASNLNQVVSFHQQLRRLEQKTDELQSLIDELRKQIAAISGTDRPTESGEDQLVPLYLNLGIDFGTSFTKICFRDDARNYSEVVTFTDEAVNLKDALLSSKIGILSDGRLLAGLTNTEWKIYRPHLQTSIDFIKMRLAALDFSKVSDPTTNEWRPQDLSVELEQPEMIENLSAYYLSRVINRSQAWIRRNKSELLINYKVVWSANVGVPVEYCDSPSLQRFKRVLSLAWLLLNEPQTEFFTIHNLPAQMSQLQSRIDQNPINCHAIPEIAAGILSFLNSREADDDRVYTFFDVGDGTLDGVFFRYWKDNDGEPKVDFYSGCVKPLGVSALADCIANELHIPMTEIKKTIVGTNDAHLDQVKNNQYLSRVHQLVGSVVGQGRNSHNDHRPVFKRSAFQNGLDVFIGGGGSIAQLYKETILSTHGKFNHKSIDIPSYNFRFIPTPKEFSMNGLDLKYFNRFNIAYGLSFPIENTPEIRLPSYMRTLKKDPPPVPETIKYEDDKDSG
jgi:hypothetical protein